MEHVLGIIIEYYRSVFRIIDNYHEKSEFYTVGIVLLSFFIVFGTFFLPLYSGLSDFLYIIFSLLLLTIWFYIGRILKDK